MKATNSIAVPRLVTLRRAPATCLPRVLAAAAAAGAAPRCRRRRSESVSPRTSSNGRWSSGRAVRNKCVHRQAGGLTITVPLVRRAALRIFPCHSAPAREETLSLSTRPPLNFGDDVYSSPPPPPVDSEVSSTQ